MNHKFANFVRRHSSKLALFILFRVAFFMGNCFVCQPKPTPQDQQIIQYVQKEISANALADMRRALWIELRNNRQYKYEDRKIIQLLGGPTRADYDYTPKQIEAQNILARQKVKEWKKEHEIKGMGVAYDFCSIEYPFYSPTFLEDGSCPCIRLELDFQDAETRDRVLNMRIADIAGFPIYSIGLFAATAV